MKPVLTPDAAAALDARSAQPVEVLMERAGLAVALAAVGMGAGYGRRVVVLAGPGNNGGDGYVAARYLSRRGVAVEVLAWSPPRSPAARWARRSAEAWGVRIGEWGPPRPAALVVDAVFGAGFSGSLPQEVADWTAISAPVLSVDVPSGLNAASGQVEGRAFCARRTVTFHAYKVGQLIGEGPDRCGEVEVADIGLSGGEAELWLCEDQDAPLPPRRRTAHKWSSGTVLVVGGSPGISGAALLAAKSALAGGAGSVGIGCPGQLQPWYETMAPGIVTLGVGKGERFAGDDVAALLEVADRYQVLVVGPGLGQGQEQLVEGVLDGWRGPLVLDADGLNAVHQLEELAARPGPTVLTPHGGEFTRLSGRPAGYLEADEVAGETGAVILLKGNPTFVLGEKRWVVRSGGPELATIGTGDVLAGLLAALWARGLEGEVAARSAAYWHGRAGRSLAERGTLTAELLAGEIGAWAW
ncbi:MAG: NAD(P)H-hydrate dehydratase [Actinomycetota bacterium]|nr:NAD(P)H-hydrate dehydratase [Actinomycetota bacterium]